MPMTILGIGSAVAGGLGSIFGGKAQGAQIRAQNQQAMRNWIASNSQKTFNNAREQFQSTYAFEQQLKRNSAIAENAYKYQYEAMDTLKANRTLAQTQMSDALSSQRATLINAVVGKGISSTSGLFGILATSQALDALEKTRQANKAFQQEREEIYKQFKGMMSQQTENIFMPNIQGYDEAPILGDARAAETGGLISGLVQIGSAVAAAGLPTKSTSAPKSSSNQFGTNLSKAPTGYSYNSTASQTTFSRPTFRFGR